MSETDYLGKEIKVGAEVVYPGRQGSSLWMNYGYVEAVEFGRIRVRRIPLSAWEKERVVWVENLNRVVVVG